jgi:hypothetical protein
MGSRVVWLQTAIFSTKPVSKKMRESQQSVFGLRLVSKEFQHPAIKTRIVQHFGGFFHEINVILTGRRLDSILYEVAQNFEVFSNIQK